MKHKKSPDAGQGDQGAIKSGYRIVTNSKNIRNAPDYKENATRRNEWHEYAV